MAVPQCPERPDRKRPRSAQRTWAAARRAKCRSDPQGEHSCSAAASRCWDRPPMAGGEAG
jgi:hypothetical protein